MCNRLIKRITAKYLWLSEVVHILVLTLSLVEVDKPSDTSTAAL